MVGEPTTFGRAWFDAFPDAEDATPLLVAARSLEDAAGSRADAPRQRDRRRRDGAHARRAAPGMTCAQAAAAWQGFVHGEGTGWKGKVELALPFSLIWSGPSIRTFTATSAAPVQEGEPTLFEIWVCADGYWADHTKNLVCGELKPRYRELEQGLLEVYDDGRRLARPGGSFAALDRRVRQGIDALGFPGQPSHPILHGIGARAHEPPYAHQAVEAEILEGMVLAIEPGCYWPEGGGLRVEDNFLVTADGPQQAQPLPGWDRECLTPRHAAARRLRPPDRRGLHGQGGARPRRSAADPPRAGGQRLRALPAHRRAAPAAEDAEEMVHRDEPLFQTVHQSSELWLKLAVLRDRGGDRAYRRRRSRARRAPARPRKPLRDPRHRRAARARAPLALGVPRAAQGAGPRQRLRLARLEAAAPPCASALGRVHGAARAPRPGAQRRLHPRARAASASTTSPRR